MNRQQFTQVVLCAGGLDTRVAPWARRVPKEFMPVAGRPGILDLLDELTALAPAQVVHRLGQDHARPGAVRSAGRAARLPRTDLPLSEQLDLAFISQRGRYADVTSVLNGADHLRAAGDVLVAFADNLYPHDNPSLSLVAVPAGQTVVLVRPYHRPRPATAAWSSATATAASSS